MALIIFLIFVLVWYLPVYRRQGKTDRLPRRTVPISILGGLIPGFLVIILLQLGLGYAVKPIKLSGIPSAAFESFISAALIEEGVKFLTGYLIVSKAKPKRKVDHALIFGAVGLGYEVTETCLMLDSPISGVFRGVFALHIIWQLWMGLYYFEYSRAKQRNDMPSARKELALALFVPFFMHGMNDFVIFVFESRQSAVDLEHFGTGSLTAGETAFLVWAAATFLFLIAEIVFQIVTFRKALRASGESRAADVSEAA